MAGEWYYKAMGQEAGPVSPAELKELAESGFLAPDVLVRKGAEGDWIPAGQVRGLFEGTFEAEAAVPRRTAPADSPRPAATIADAGTPLAQAALPPTPPQPPPEGADWYCRVMGKEIGPLSRSALAELARSGFLAPGALVREGMDGPWVPSTEVKGLFDGSPAPRSEREPRRAPAGPGSPLSEAPADNRGDAFREAPQKRPSRPPASEGGWYCQVMGEETGPLSSAQLKELAASGFLTPDVPVRKGVDGSWVPASRVKGLFPGASPPPGQGKTDAPAPTRPDSKPSARSDRGGQAGRASAKPAAARPQSSQIGWYYEARGKETGPLSSADLKELARSGLLTPDMPVRMGTDGDWLPAGQVLGLFDEPSPAAPAKKARRPSGPVSPPPSSPSDSDDFLDESLMVPLPDKPISAAPRPEAGRSAQGTKRTRLRGSP